MTKAKIIIAVAIALVIGLIGGYVISHTSNNLVGAVGGQLIEDSAPYIKINGGIRTNLPILAQNGFTIGSSTTSSSLNNFQYGTCSPSFYGTSFLATTTGTFVCSVSGVNAGDYIIGDMGSGASASAYGSFVQVSAYSTTTGIIAFSVMNLTGQATSSFPLATSTFEYLDIR